MISIGKCALEALRLIVDHGTFCNDLEYAGKVSYVLRVCMARDGMICVTND